MEEKQKEIEKLLAEEVELNIELTGLNTEFTSVTSGLLPGSGSGFQDDLHVEKVLEKIVLIKNRLKEIDLQKRKLKKQFV